ncbi:MAG TPA: hypothetical protein VN329_06145 [Roseomonas sp.]|nr:hypothetical protein [Roseomonas sp.]
MVAPMRAFLPVALLVAAPDLVAGGEPMPRVTTDSREYCVELADRLLELPGAREETVRRLAEDGMRLCETGHPRTGVAKLRRAIRAAQMQP